jgi:hypothetical protein
MQFKWLMLLLVLTTLSVASWKLTLQCRDSAEQHVCVRATVELQPPIDGFSDAAGATRLSDGSVLLVDGPLAQLSRFSPRGRIQATRALIGPAGDSLGPLSAFRGTASDTSIAFSGTSGTAWVIDGAGNAVTAARLAGARSQMDGQAFLAMDGTIYVHRGWSLSAMPRPMTDGLAFANEVVLRYRTEDSQPDTVIERPGLALDVSTSPNGFFFRPVPFGGRLHVGASANAIVFGDGRSAEVLFYGLESSITTALQVMAPLPGCEMDTAAASTESLVYSGIAVQADNRFWLACPSDDTSPPTVWVRYSRDGEPSGHIYYPQGARILEAASDYLILAVADESERYHLVLLGQRSIRDRVGRLAGLFVTHR